MTLWFGLRTFAISLQRSCRRWPHLTMMPSSFYLQCLYYVAMVISTSSWGSSKFLKFIFYKSTSYVLSLVFACSPLNPTMAYDLPLTSITVGSTKLVFDEVSASFAIHSSAFFNDFSVCKVGNQLSYWLNLWIVLISSSMATHSHMYSTRLLKLLLFGWNL